MAGGRVYGPLRGVSNCEDEMDEVAILGAGSWGMTLAMLARGAGSRTRLWMRDPEAARALRSTGLTGRRLGGMQIPPDVVIETNVDAALKGAGIVVFAVPCAAIGDVSRLAARSLPVGAVAVSVAKGLEQGSLRQMTEVMRDALGERHSGIAALSGPNLAPEIAAGKHAATVVASRDQAVADRVAKGFASPRFRIYTSLDVTGVELGGALKNVIALAAGMADGLDAGENGKAALMCRGLAEISRLGVAMGADPLTFAGLAGMGDMIATCASPLSRNHRAGRMLADGVPVHEIRSRLGEVAEGIPTAAAAVALGRRHGVDLPIAAEVAAVIAGATRPEEAVERLMGRDLRAERD